MRPSHHFVRVLTLALLVAAFAGACAGAGEDSVPADDPVAGNPPVLADPVDTARDLVDQFFGALQAGDRAAVAAIVAPEARIARANGDVVAGDAYLDQLPLIQSYAIDGVDGSQQGDVLVVTYQVEVEEIIGGAPQPVTEAPRLTVFQWRDGAWRLIAHANFGAINRPADS